MPLLTRSFNTIPKHIIPYLNRPIYTVFVHTCLCCSHDNDIGYKSDARKVVGKDVQEFDVGFMLHSEGVRLHKNLSEIITKYLCTQ